MSRPLAVVSGGQRGIGLGIALALADAGFDLGIISLPPVDDPEVRTACQQLQERGASVQYYSQDLTQVEALPALLANLEDTAGPIHCGVLNAGVAPRQRGDLLAMSSESFDTVLGVNLRGSFFLAQALARRLLAGQADGLFRSLIFITSVSAATVSVERGEYCISKAGLAMAAQLYATRLAAAGVGVYEIQPGIIATGMTAAVREHYDARIAEGLVPQGRWGQPADVGRAVAALARGDFAYATGATLRVDGGLGIHRL